MSAAALAWAFDQRHVRTPCGRLVLLVLADFARPDGAAAFVSLERLSERTGMCADEVAWHLENLELAGLIRPCRAPLLERLSGRIPQGYQLAIDRRSDPQPRRSPPNLTVLPGGHP